VFVSRRDFISSAGATLVGFAGLRGALAAQPLAEQSPFNRFGPLVRDPNGFLDLPKGFGYRVVSAKGREMADGLLVPGRPDGMAAFAGEDGLTLLIKNHEMSPDPADEGAFGSDFERLDRIDSTRLFDAGTDGRPGLGGTTSVLYDTRTGRVLEERLSLGGTLRNCAGGPTPWGTWITCEETVERAGGRLSQTHGYNFEVPARMDDLPVQAVPIRDMGRFNHEAVAVLPESGIVYQTEDRGDGLVYRFVPNVPGDLLAGGRLQALAVRDRPSLDTRNWGGLFRRPQVRPGGAAPVEWIDLHDVESPEDDLRYQGHEAGAARFARGEGMWYAGDAVFFACTNGGGARRGQIWRYKPSPEEGGPGESDRPGTLELFLEATRSSLLENADNITVAPWGDLFVCEDGGGTDYLVGVTPEAQLYRFARNRRSEGELCGCVFSPDGSTLFLNMQIEGLTLAITGPWTT
jgi:secreted PhoX family phosphatase